MSSTEDHLEKTGIVVDAFCKIVREVIYMITGCKTLVKVQELGGCIASRDQEKR